MTDVWHFAVVRGVSKWIGYAKREPFIFLGHKWFAVIEPGELHFEFGETEEEALANIRRSAGN